jgi:hypothetical protein
MLRAAPDFLDNFHNAGDEFELPHHMEIGLSPLLQKFDSVPYDRFKLGVVYNLTCEDYTLQLNRQLLQMLLVRPGNLTPEDTRAFVLKRLGA